MRAIILLLMILMLYAFTGASYVYSDEKVRVSIESVESYSSVGERDLPYSNDAAEAFINVFSGDSQFEYQWWSDYAAWPSDWWSEYVGGDTWASYHVYRWHYAIFIGHGNEGIIAFGVTKDGPVEDTYIVNIAGYTSDLEPHVYFHKVGTATTYTLWAVFASCKTLYDPEPWGDNSKVKLIAEWAFNGNGDLWDLAGTYLHGMVGMRTDFLEANALGIDYASPTLQAFAEKLRSGKPVKTAWFEAVSEHQRNCIGPFCTFVGKAAALSLKMQAFDENSQLVDEANYIDCEGMYLYGTTYMDPRVFLETYTSQGYTVTYTWYYVYQP
ncbi:MAG: hypothetical protein DRO40_12375 [Thermoprotei archaeon]|nr:MAG: hypothetical protein DRO40_12375 [Thermoprotei archaeon]